MASKKTTEGKNGIEVTGSGSSQDLILTADMASAIWNGKPGKINICVGSGDNIVGTAVFNKIGNRAAFYFEKAERKGNA